jgi:hypothetical protein
MATIHAPDWRAETVAGGSMKTWVGGAESSVCQGSSSLRLVAEDGPTAGAGSDLAERDDFPVSTVQMVGVAAGSVVGGAGGSVERFVVGAGSSVSAGGGAPLRSST